MHRCHECNVQTPQGISQLFLFWSRQVDISQHQFLWSVSRWSYLASSLTSPWIQWLLWLVTQSCLCGPTDCNPPGSSVHGILQARIPEWVAIPLFRGDLPDPGIKPRSPALQILYHLSHQGSPKYNGTSSLKKIKNRTSNFSPQIWSSIHLLQLQKIRDHPCYSSFSHSTFNPCSIPSHFTSKRDLKLLIKKKNMQDKIKG